MKHPRKTQVKFLCNRLTFWEKIQLFQEKIQLFRKKCLFSAKISDNLFFLSYQLWFSNFHLLIDSKICFFWRNLKNYRKTLDLLKKARQNPRPPWKIPEPKVGSKKPRSREKTIGVATLLIWLAHGLLDFFIAEKGHYTIKITFSSVNLDWWNKMKSL